MSILTNLLNRVRNLEARVAASKGDGAGGFAPLTVELRDGDDEEQVIAAALAERERQGRPIVPITGGLHGPISMVIVDMRAER